MPPWSATMPACTPPVDTRSPGTRIAESVIMRFPLSPDPTCFINENSAEASVPDSTGPQARHLPPRGPHGQPGHSHEHLIQHTAPNANSRGPCIVSILILCFFVMLLLLARFLRYTCAHMSMSSGHAHSTHHVQAGPERELNNGRSTPP